MKIGFKGLFGHLPKQEKRRVSLKSPSADFLVHYESINETEANSDLRIVLQDGEVGFLCPAAGLPLRLDGPLATSAADHLADDDLEGVFFISPGEKLASKFGVPYFEVFDGVHPQISVGIAARGEYLFTIDDPETFVRKNRLRHFEVRAFSRRLQEAVSQRIKSVMANLPISKGISVLQIERQIDEIAALVSAGLFEEVAEDFGVKITRFKISALEPEKGSPNYEALIRMTRDSAERLHEAEVDKKVEKIRDPQTATSTRSENKERIDF
jgi:hypothetical protein